MGAGGAGDDLRRRGASAVRWGLGAIAFVGALQLVWPTPAGILVWGVVLSSLSALLALGLALIYRSHRVINFAQADLGAVPASLAVSLVALAGWSYWVAVPFALVVAAVLGAAVEFLVIRRFARAPRLILMVATIGLAQLLAGFGQAIPGFFGASFPPYGLPPPFDFRFEIDPFIFHANELVTVVATVGVIAGLFAFLRYTNIGIALRASADRADRASLLGVNVGLTQNVAWVLAALIGAVAMILRAGTLGLPLRRVLRAVGVAAGARRRGDRADGEPRGDLPRRVRDRHRRDRGALERRVGDADRPGAVRGRAGRARPAAPPQRAGARASALVDLGRRRERAPGTPRARAPARGPLAVPSIACRVRRVRHRARRSSSTSAPPTSPPQC